MFHDGHSDWNDPDRLNKVITSFSCGDSSTSLVVPLYVCTFCRLLFCPRNELSF
jgi:hypothetical protein